MKSIRCGRGLGDSIYLQSVVRHLVQRDGEPLRVHSDWPDVFSHLGNSVEVVPFSRFKIDILAHYASRKSISETTQFKDCCLNAGINESVELKLNWPAVSGPLIDEIKASGLPIVCVQLPRAPMGRTDGFGAEILPDCRTIQKMIDRLKYKATIVQVGAGEPLFKFRGIDFNLANKTTVKELIDVASVASGFIGYCSFILALSESLDKPSIMVWSQRGLASKDLYIRQITPQKIIEKSITQYVMDDCTEEEMTKALNGFLR